MPRILLMAGGSPVRLAVLAQQIEQHIENAEICGMVYVRPSWSLAATTSQIGAAAWSLLSRFAFGIVHGGSPKAVNSGFKSVAKQCRVAGWELRSVRNLESPEIIKFVKDLDPELLICASLGSVPGEVGCIPRLGTLSGTVSKDGAHEPGTLGVAAEVRRIAPRIGDSAVARVEILKQKFDTPVSLDLKANVVMRDLLVQSAKALLAYPEAEVAMRVSQWATAMVPECFTRAEFTTSDFPAPPLRTRAKWKLAFYSLFLLSPPALWQRWRRRWSKRHSVVFLNSHLITDRPHPMTLPTEVFLREVEFLRRHYRIVGLAEAVRLLESGEVSHPTVVLSFDDGYDDNFLNLRAISEELDVPVVMFISTDAVSEHREFPHDVRKGAPNFRALSWDQIRYWQADGTEFHSHTCSHFDCGSTDVAVLEDELGRSKRSLEQELAKPATAFAFPWGKPKNMSAVARAIADRTYEQVLSRFGGENFPGGVGSAKHVLRKPMLANVWECELETQGVFESARALKRSLTSGSGEDKPVRVESRGIEAAANRETQNVGS